MSLSKLNIELLVEQITDKYIKGSNYSTLRNSCILLEPVSFVTSEIKKELTHILQSDQNESASHLILDACKKQLQYDLDEKIRDHNEAQDDLSLSSKLQSKLKLIHEQIRSSELEIHKDKEHCQQLQLHIKRIEEAQKKNEEATHHHSHLETKESSHNHTHPAATDKHDTKTHTHPEATDKHKTTHTHPQTTTHHGHPEADFEVQKRILTSELILLQRNLESKQLSHQKLLAQNNKINRELNLELPEREEHRQMRALARDTREKARLIDDPTLLQLSEQNRTLVKETIEAKHKKLHQKEVHLMQKANEISYQTYLTRLEIHLQSLTNLSYQENEALKHIVQHIHEYLLIKVEEQKLSLEHNRARLEKEQLVANKLQKEKSVDQFKKSNPQLTSQNLLLEEENKRLEITIEEHRSYRNTLSKIGLFFLFLTGGAAGAGVAVAGGILAVTSLLMAPAAVLAFITLSLFITALAYTIKNCIDSNQLSKNQTTIENNLATITQQNSEMILLESKTLPELTNKISEAEDNLSKLKKRIEGFQQHAELKLTMAKQVNVTNPSSQPLFIIEQQTPQNPYQGSTEPSAPPVDDLPIINWNLQT